MINKLIKAGVLLRFFIWFKPRFNSLLLTISIITIVWLIHGEFLRYTQHSGNATYLGASFFVKWVIIILTMFGCFIYQKKQVKREGFSVESKMKQQDSKSGNDGFDFLRKKEMLESRGDKIIQNKIDKGENL